MVGLLADCAVASAMQTLLPAGTAYAPIDLKVRPARTDGRDLTATGRVANPGRSILVRPGQPASLTAAAEPLEAETDAVS